MELAHLPRCQRDQAIEVMAGPEAGSSQGCEQRIEQNLVNLSGNLSHKHLSMVYGGLEVAIRGSQGMTSCVVERSPATPSPQKEKALPLGGLGVFLYTIAE